MIFTQIKTPQGGGEYRQPQIGRNQGNPQVLRGNIPGGYCLAPRTVGSNPTTLLLQRQSRPRNSHITMATDRSHCSLDGSTYGIVRPLNEERLRLNSGRLSRSVVSELKTTGGVYPCACDGRVAHGTSKRELVGFIRRRQFLKQLKRRRLNQRLVWWSQRDLNPCLSLERAPS